jgi:hypothetical protein
LGWQPNRVLGASLKTNMTNIQPKITHENDKIYLRFTTSEFDKVGVVDYTNDLWQMIRTAKWRTDKNYIYSGKESLHRLVMEYWYGKEHCKQKIKSGSVIDHIDNDGFNCTYENLEFLDRIKNWTYKGQYYDRKRSKATSIAAIHIFKNKSGDRFQITIGFNVPFYNSQGQAISKAFLAYNTLDYDLVLSDAVQLVESVERRKIQINHLRCNHLKYELQRFIKTNGIPLRAGNVINVNGEWLMVQGDGVQIEKIALDNAL